MKKYLPLLLCLMPLFTSGCFFSAPDTTNVMFNFIFVVDGELLEMDAARYTSDDGYTYQVDALNLYVSNLTFSKGEARYAVPDSYHLKRLDASGFDRLYIEDVPVHALETLELGIGIDPEANTRLDAVGELNPSNQMAWDWNTGYKFLRLEGEATKDGLVLPLLYHIGGSDNYTTLTFDMRVDELAEGQAPAEELQVDIWVEVAELFKNPNPLPMGEYNNVQFESAADLMAENWQTGFLRLETSTWVYNP